MVFREGPRAERGRRCHLEMRRGQTTLVRPLSSDLREVSSWHLVGEHIPLVDAHLSLRPHCLRDLLPSDSDRNGALGGAGTKPEKLPRSASQLCAEKQEFEVRGEVLARAVRTSFLP